jgi:hypothetical protein
MSEPLSYQTVILWTKEAGKVHTGDGSIDTEVLVGEGPTHRYKLAKHPRSDYWVIDQYPKGSPREVSHNIHASQVISMAACELHARIEGKG